MTTPLDRIEATRRRLEAACIFDGEWVSADGSRVTPATAARLLDLSPGTLKNMRADGRGPEVYHLPGNGAKVTYALADLAAYIEGLRR